MADHYRQPGPAEFDDAHSEYALVPCHTGTSGKSQSGEY